MKPTILPVIAALAWTLGSSQAQPASANSISFQGALNGADGKPLANGNYNFTFKFYDGATNPQALAITNVPKVSVTGGIASTPIPVDAAWFNGQTRYLGIIIAGPNGEQELLPRVLITAVPYALSALSLNNGSVNVSSNGNVGIGTAPTQYKLEVNGSVASQRINLDGGPAFAQNFEANSRFQGLNNTQGALFRVWDNFLDGTIGLLVNYKYGVGSFDVLRVYNGTPDDYVFSVDNNGETETRALVVSGQPGRTSPALDVNGTTRTKVLQITGGADLAEPFDVTSDVRGAAIIPGMVTVIDREHDGKLASCARAYDTAVAGVISGANSLSPGLVMKAEGQPHADGEQPLAMTGRVWCWVDASAKTGGGPVKRGDRLTTSATFGHGMKVADESKAAGAVIGKAMTELADGKGLVLVLVNLQ